MVPDPPPPGALDRSSFHSHDRRWTALRQMIRAVPFSVKWLPRGHSYIAYILLKYAIRTVDVPFYLVLSCLLIHSLVTLTHPGMGLTLLLRPGHFGFCNHAMIPRSINHYKSLEHNPDYRLPFTSDIIAPIFTLWITAYYNSS